jgi:predicted NodU family carbamoyl transferase
VCAEVRLLHSIAVFLPPSPGENHGRSTQLHVLKAPMNILGVSAFYHDSATALVQDGVIVAAAQEERFTRRKHDASFPANALAYCLREAGITAADLSAVVFYEKPLVKADRLIETSLLRAMLDPKTLRALCRDMLLARSIFRYMQLVATVAEEKRLPIPPDQKSSWGIELLNVQRSSIPAVTHVDFSARIQTVNPERHGLFYYSAAPVL